MPHNCLHEDKLNRIDNEIFGNGQEGLSKKVTRIESDFCNWVETMEQFRIIISGFNKFQIETEKEQELLYRSNERHETNKKWFIGTSIALGSLLVTVLGIIFFA